MSEYGKIQPQATELEEAVLSVLMTVNGSMSQIAAMLDESDFYTTAHESIFKAALSLYARNEAIDMLTVITECKKLGLEADASKIAAISSKTSSSAHLESHCRIVKQKSIRRKIIAESANMAKSAFDDTIDPLTLLNESDMLISSIKESISKGRKSTKAEIVDQLVHRMRRGTIGFHLTGIPAVDRVIGRVEPGELIVVGGRPGMGKSIFGNTIGRNLSIEQNKRLLFWALEMTNEQNMRRLISNVGDISYSAMKRGDIPLDQFESVINRIVKSKYEFEDLSGVNALDVRSRAITESKGEGLDILLIDHGGLLNNMNPKNLSTVAEVSNTTKLLKQTAKDLNMPIILFWQLNREVEKRAGCVPRLSDLRDSGSIEQDADKVIFLYRPEYYKINEFDLGDRSYNSDGLAVMICEKNREGLLGKAPMRFNPENMRFESYEDNFDNPIKFTPDAPMKPNTSNKDVPF